MPAVLVEEWVEPVVEAPVELDKIGKRLEMAAALLRVEGWIQGSFHTGQGYCALGAMLAVTGGIGTRTDSGCTTDYQEMKARVAHHLNILDAKGCRDAKGQYRIDCWNDIDGRTKEEVIAALRAAAHSTRRIRCQS